MENSLVDFKPDATMKKANKNANLRVVEFLVFILFIDYEFLFPFPMTCINGEPALTIEYFFFY